MSDESDEVLIGDFPVVARLNLGTEHLRLFVTNRRLLVAHLGKRGAGSVAGSTILGKLSSAFEDLLKNGRESRRLKSFERNTPETILAANKENFALRFDEVVSVGLTENYSTTSITLLTREDKFEFVTRSKIEDIARVLSRGLPDRLTVNTGRRG
jgi:hypothetical protein